MRMDVSRDNVTGISMYHAVLSSGMDAYFMPLDPSVMVSMFHVFTRFGSIDAKFRDEKGKVIEVKDGTAHFLEHCAFYDPDGSMATDWFNERGVYSNAWTSFDHTTYHFQSTGSNTRRNLEYLLKFVTTPYLTDAIVKKEQGAIGQEIAMYDDRPGWALMQNLRLALFCEHPIRRSLGGDKESIMQITKEYLQRAYDTFYRPSNLTLVAFMPSAKGERDAKKLFMMAESISSKLGFSQRKAPEYLYVAEQVEVKERKIIAQHHVPEPLVALGFKARTGMEGSTEERLRSDIVNDLLAETILSDSSKAVFDIIQAGDARSLSGGHNSGRGFGYFAISGSAKNAERFEEVVVSMIREQARGKLSREIFENRKRAMISSIARDLELEDPEDLESRTIHMRAAGFEIAQLIPVLQGIRFEDTLEAGRKYLDTDNYAVSVLLPKAEPN
ncbi:MAG TPA: insulinase family protein [Nanoarchaeota archaeon]|nr:insulinase family protein [Nanoarchaeota archaeon]